MITEKPDRDRIRWNNTTLSSLAETYFSSELSGKTEMVEWGRKGVQSKSNLQEVRFYLANHPKVNFALGPYGILKDRRCRRDVSRTAKHTPSFDTTISNSEGRRG